MDFTSLEKLKKIYPIAIEKYDTFIPNVEEENILIKTNLIIQYLNRIGKLNNDVVRNWNEVMKWVMNDGLDEVTNKKINELLESGLFDQLVGNMVDEKSIEVDQKLQTFDAQLAQNTQQVMAINPFKINPKREVYSIFQSNEWTDRLNSGSTVSNDTVNKKTGTQGIKLTATETEAGIEIVKPWNLLDKILYVDLFVEDTSKFNSISILFDVSSGFTSYFQTGANNYELINGWNTIALYPANFVKAGSTPPTPDQIANIRLTRIRVNNKSGQTSNITLDRMYAVKNTLTKAKILINFDDGERTVYHDAKPIMDKYGFPGVAYVVTSNWTTNKADRIPFEGLVEMQNSGWDIASHTHTHKTLTQISPEELTNELVAAKKWLLDNGFERGARHIAYPGGQQNQAVKAEVRKHYYTGRCTIPVEDGFPPADITSLKCKDVSNVTTVATVKGWIDQAIASKSVLTLLFHYIVTPADVATQYPHSQFEEIMQYLSSKQDQLDVVTLSDLLDSYGN